MTIRKLLLMTIILVACRQPPPREPDVTVLASRTGGSIVGLDQGHVYWTEPPRQPPEREETRDLFRVRVEGGTTELVAESISLGVVEIADGVAFALRGSKIVRIDAASRRETVLVTRCDCHELAVGDRFVYFQGPDDSIQRVPREGGADEVVVRIPDLRIWKIAADNDRVVWANARQPFSGHRDGRRVLHRDVLVETLTDSGEVQTLCDSPSELLDAGGARVYCSGSGRYSAMTLASDGSKEETDLGQQLAQLTALDDGSFVAFDVREHALVRAVPGGDRRVVVASGIDSQSPFALDHAHVYLFRGDDLLRVDRMDR